MNFEEQNVEQIDRLCQRGTTLSIVDLINANTLSVDMAAYSLYAIANGASFLTAARPGNAGKSTSLACLMTFLPPEEKITVVTDAATVAEAAENVSEENKVCVLCHEIGSGPVPGYIWNECVGQYMHLMSSGTRIASCLHADTLSETRGIMVSENLAVSEADFNRMGLFLFLDVEEIATGYRRRIATLYESNGEAEEHNLLFKWHKETDTFTQEGEPLLLKRIVQQNGKSIEQVSEEYQRCRSFMEELVSSGKTDFRWVRKQVVDFYDGK